MTPLQFVGFLLGCKWPEREPEVLPHRVEVKNVWSFPSVGA